MIRRPFSLSRVPKPDLIRTKATHIVLISPPHNNQKSSRSRSLPQGKVAQSFWTTRHNHGYRTVDPLKRKPGLYGILWCADITTVLGPWTH